MKVDHPVTLVSTYYKLKKAKNKHNRYKQWMKNFFYNIETPLIIFTDKENEPFIRNLRRKKLKKTILIIKEFSSLQEYPRFVDAREQHSMDPEKDIHSLDLYIIWNEKINFIREAHEKNPFNSKWFFWMDIGAFRNRKKLNDLSIKEIKRWPSLERVNSLLPKNKTIFLRTGKDFNPKNFLLIVKTYSLFRYSNITI